MLESPGRLPRRLPLRLRLGKRGRDRRELLFGAGESLRGRRRRREQARRFALGLGGVALARCELLGDLRSGLGDPREGRRHAFGGEVDLVAGVARGDALAGGVQGACARLLEIPLERRAGGGRIGGQPVRLLAGERAGAGLRDRPREALLEVGQVAGRPRLFRGEVPAFALERRPPRREVESGAPVGLEQGVVSRDRGLERGQGLAQRVAPRRRLARLEARGGERGFGASEGRRGLGLAVAPLVAQLFVRGQGLAESVGAGARERRPPELEQLGVLLVPRRARSLAPERDHVALDLGDDVGEPEQVALGLLELALGQPLLELVLRDARGLLDEAPAVLGLGREHLIDPALLDDGVGAHAETRPEELVLDVPEADLLVVEEVLALAVAIDPAAHPQLALGVALLGVPVRSREGQDHLGHPEGPPLGGAVEDDVVHRLAAKDARALLAQRPGHGVADVGFAAAVGADDGRDRAREGQIDLLVEGLKARNLDPFQPEH